MPLAAMAATWRSRQTTLPSTQLTTQLPRDKLKVNPSPEVWIIHHQDTVSVYKSDRLHLPMNTFGKSIFIFKVSCL